MRESIPLLPLALSDTARTVTALIEMTPDSTTTGPTDEGLSFGPDLASLRARCLEHVAKLREEMESQPADVCEDAVYAQCALLDEIALARLTGDHRDAWESEPLQVREFRSHNAGEALITRIERRLAEPEPAPVLLAIFHAVLGLGFRGRFALEGAEARAALMRTLDTRLHQAVPRDEGNPVIAMSDGAARSGKPMPPLVWVGVGGLIAAWVYLGLNRWLGAAIAQLGG